MMDCRNKRQATSLKIENTVGNGLIVVDDIEVFFAANEPPFYSLAKGIGFRETAGQFAEPLNAFEARKKMPKPHRTQSVLVQIEAIELY
jgi:hypothetical protein